MSDSENLSPPPVPEPESLVQVPEIPSEPVSDAGEPLPPLPVKGSDWLSVLQLALSAIAILGLWGIAFVMGLMGVVGMGSVPGGQANAGFLVQAGGLFFCGILVIPSLVTAIRRLQGRPYPLNSRSVLRLHPIIPLLLLIPVLGIGFLASRDATAGTVLLPMLHGLAVVLPVLFLVILGVRGLPIGSPQRASGVFSAGLVLGPLLIVIAESAALIGILIIVIIVIMGKPDMAQLVMEISTKLGGISNDPEAIMDALAGYIVNPIVLMAVITFASIIVPLIEELFKPIGVWFLARRGLTPAAGFAAGLLSGAGYAVFESIALNTAGEDWLMVVVARIGTAVIHILTAGFSGWALASTWRDRRYLRVPLTYLGVVAVHGFWNAVTLVSAAKEIAATSEIALDAPMISVIGTIGPYILIGLTILSFIVLLLMNKNLKRPQNPQPVVE